VRENHSAKELDMPMKRYKPEQIVTLLRQIEVEIANGKTTQACKLTYGAASLNAELIAM
jgi:hypothetical protein